MVNIYITEYDESNDTFSASVADHALDTAYDAKIPAFLIPYIAPALCAEVEDIPFDLVGKSFDLRLQNTL